MNKKNNIKFSITTLLLSILLMYSGCKESEEESFSTEPTSIEYLTELSINSVIGKTNNTVFSFTGETNRDVFDSNLIVEIYDINNNLIRKLEGYMKDGYWRTSTISLNEGKYYAIAKIYTKTNDFIEEVKTNIFEVDLHTFVNYTNISNEKTTLTYTTLTGETDTDVSSVSVNISNTNTGENLTKNALINKELNENGKYEWSAYFDNLSEGNYISDVIAVGDVGNNAITSIELFEIDTHTNFEISNIEYTTGEFASEGSDIVI